ncbi:MAG: hypothetical protein COS09_00090 [Candidatus Nealsonbacteria bacterium CG01_land_8_20_14_3_00_12]|uniref:HD domain-containing protein n=1 Tax=Candidatus Nealsonbacteria bacterium CG01_land_8_20_14_3_00_12 TaxID=1974697 RepID=A0A2M7ECC0_9BACT|nr:MAG: hypothetical protein COS09_00090 [Candidatus Nealsonbacteria bacterium CG01_land_8_20_14_3_00_12]
MSVQQIKISEFTIERIQNREFEKLIPEFYELKEIVENNPWHNNDSVLNHTISLLKELEELIKKPNDKIKVYLDKKINTHSREKLLFLAALLHDIGKKETYKKEKDITECLRHEEVGAIKLKTILPRFDLSENEREFVIKLVRNHGFFHEILNYPEENPEKKTEEFKGRHPDIFLEIILLSIADMCGSQLKLNKPEEFNFRMNSLNKILS